jgi:hypothetical protein
MNDYVRNRKKNRNLSPVRDELVFSTARFSIVLVDPMLFGHNLRLFRGLAAIYRDADTS